MQYADNWDHDLYDVRETRAPRQVASIETGSKLLISNLHYNVTDEDIKVSLLMDTVLVTSTFRRHTCTASYCSLTAVVCLFCFLRSFSRSLDL
jgi:hypothetical protein